MSVLQCICATLGLHLTLSARRREAGRQQCGVAAPAAAMPLELSLRGCQIDLPTVDQAGLAAQPASRQQQVQPSQRQQAASRCSAAGGGPPPPSRPHPPPVHPTHAHATHPHRLLPPRLVPPSRPVLVKAASKVSLQHRLDLKNGAPPAGAAAIEWHEGLEPQQPSGGEESQQQQDGRRIEQAGAFPPCELQPTPPLLAACSAPHPQSQSHHLPTHPPTPAQQGQRRLGVTRPA